MPDVIYGPPEAGNYKYVLVHYRYPPNATYAEYMGGSVCKSRVIEWPEGMSLPDPKPDRIFAPKQPGDRVCAMFTNSPLMRDRLYRSYWDDVTDDWNAAVAPQPAPEPEPDPTPKPKRKRSRKSTSKREVIASGTGAAQRSRG